MLDFCVQEKDTIAERTGAKENTIRKVFAKTKETFSQTHSARRGVQIQRKYTCVPAILDIPH